MDAAISPRESPPRVGRRTATREFGGGGRRAVIRGLLLSAGCLMLFAPQSLLAQSTGQRSIALELYVRGDEHADIRQWLTAAVAERRGVNLRVFDVAAEGDGRARHEKICAHFKRTPAEAVPALYACSQLVVAPADQKKLEQTLDELRSLTVYVRSGCPRCARTKDYLKTVQEKYPGFRLVYRDVATDSSAQSEMNTVARRYNKSAVSVPMFHYCNQVLIGFDSPAGTGRRLEAVLDKWTFEKKKPADSTSSRATGDARPFAHRRAARSRIGVPARPQHAPRFAASIPSPIWYLGLGGIPDQTNLDEDEDAGVELTIRWRNACRPPAKPATSHCRCRSMTRTWLPLPSDVDGDQ
jgi:glutaredoxin